MSLSLLLTIKSLYAANGFFAVLLYLPQIVGAWKDRHKGGSLSLLTFGGWSLGSLITALYAWFFVHDPLFTAVSLGNMLGAGAIFAVVLYSRLRSASRPSFLHRHGTKRTVLRVSLSTSPSDSRT